MSWVRPQKGTSRPRRCRCDSCKQEGFGKLDSWGCEIPPSRWVTMKSGNTTKHFCCWACVSHFSNKAGLGSPQTPPKPPAPRVKLKNTPVSELQARKVVCPICNAYRGRPCRGFAGRFRVATSHPERKAKYRVENGLVKTEWDILEGLALGVGEEWIILPRY